MTANQDIPQRKRRSREEVRRLVIEFEASGSRPTEFCRNHSLAPSTLQRHLKRRRLGNAAAETRGELSRTLSNLLVAVKLARMEENGNRRPACALRVVLSSGRRIEVDPDFESDTFERLVKILERLQTVFGLGPATRIYLALGATDLRKGFAVEI